MDIASVSGSAAGAALGATPVNGIAEGIQTSLISSTENLQSDLTNRLFSTLGLGTNVSASG